MASYGRRAKSGFIWGMLGRTSTTVVAMATSIVMARILTPYDFGVAAAAGFFIQIAQRLTNLGFNTALVRLPEVRADHATTVFAINVALGVGGGLALVLAGAVAGDVLPKSRRGLRDPRWRADLRDRQPRHRAVGDARAPAPVQDARAHRVAVRVDDLIEQSRPGVVRVWLLESGVLAADRRGPGRRSQVRDGSLATPVVVLVRGIRRAVVVRRGPPSQASARIARGQYRQHGGRARPRHHDARVLRQVVHDDESCRHAGRVRRTDCLAERPRPDPERLREIPRRRSGR